MKQRPTPQESGILILGVGMIGGSLAAALKQQGYPGVIRGSDVREEELVLGQQMGLIDSGDTDPLTQLDGISMIVLCVPVMAIGSLIERLAPHVADRDIVVTDVGSSKSVIRDAVVASMGYLPPWLVLGHPISGAEHTGVAAADPERYVAHKVILTPEPQTAERYVERVAAVWEAAGAEVVTMSVERHDDILARTSHLPHLLAFSLVDTLARQDEGLDIFRYAAGGFRDFTRIAGSDPVMWRDIFLGNRDAVLGALDDFEAGLARLRRAIEEGDAESLHAIFQCASQARHHFQTLLNQTTS